jgi:hypothetical protein
MRPTLAFTHEEVVAMVDEAEAMIVNLAGTPALARGVLARVINREVERKRSAINAYDARVNSVGCEGGSA